MTLQHAGMPTSGLLVRGRNCWRIERARRLAFFVDACFYFAAVRESIAQARRSVFILGWDFDSRIPLVPQGANDGYPEPLGDFLTEVVRRKRDLHVHVLSWDFVTAFAGNREWLPLYKLGWKTHPAPRLSFRLDDETPVTGSQHQKVVVVDDRVAFVGGLDLTHGRWDTSEHWKAQPYRLDARGRQARPNHDVQAVVDGAAAAALGDLCRDRWRRAAGREPVMGTRATVGDPWPRSVEPVVTDLDVAVARTDPGFGNGTQAEEIRQLYTDVIGAAKRTLYLENQYFSSSVLGMALEARLREPEGPEVVVVSRLTEEGWLEQNTMGLLRARLHQRLRRADAHDRYRLLYPHIPGLELPNLLNVHSKVLIADDELLSVGSANFNNRSMGFDTECNIAIEAGGDPRVAGAIAHLRERLLVEHLATDARAFAHEAARHRSSLVRTITALQHPGRTLKSIDPIVTPGAAAMLPAHVLIDPERPVPLEELAVDFVPEEAHKPLARRAVTYAAWLVSLAALLAIARWSVLGEPVGALLTSGRELAHAPMAPLVALAVYAIGALTAVPIAVLVIATGMLFGPVPGGLYAYIGTLTNAAIAYWLGWRLGRHRVRTLAGSQLNRITRQFARKGFLAIATIRMLRVAPFWKVNIVAGASHIRWRDFLVGTTLGIGPPIVLTVVFVDRAEAAIVHPGVGTFLGLAIVAALLVGGAALMWRRFSVERTRNRNGSRS